jgi:hypothetical protein
MDNKTLDMEVFLKSLTAEQADACNRDEKQLAAIFSAGWSEATAVCFHRAMLHARRIYPNATVEGLFESAFQLGLSFIGDEEVLARVMQDREGDVIVSGVQRRDRKDAGRTACIVSPDVVALAKLRRKGAVRVIGVPGNRHARAGVSIREA